MGFSYTVDKVNDVGGMAHAMGTYTSAAGSTGGDINTGLTSCFFLGLQPVSATVATNVSVVNETPLTTGNVSLRGSFSGKTSTIVTDANQSGLWFAIGYR